MKPFKWLMVVVGAYVLAFASSYNVTLPQTLTAADRDALPPIEESNSGRVESSSASRYTLDATRSKFIAHALAGGLLWFKGHDHLVAVRDFSGEAALDPDSLDNSSLQITAKAASMEETSSVFTEPQKKIIDKELREIVLLPDQYPDIVFRAAK